jgi:hypothetical protein
MVTGNYLIQEEKIMSYIKEKYLTCILFLIILMLMPISNNTAKGISSIDLLEKKEDHLDNVPTGSWLGLPAYDSGWYDLGTRPDPISVQFFHNLGGDTNDYVVTLSCQDNTTLGIYDCIDQGFNYNAHWYALTNTSISVYASGGIRPDSVRVKIYKPAVLYDSGWYDLGVRPDPITVTFNHNLGGGYYDYLIDLECRHDGSLGMYNCIDNSFNVNAQWYNLNNNVNLRTYVGSVLPDDVRVRIFITQPSYNSGWMSLGTRPDPISVVFSHNLIGDVGNYYLDLQCYDDVSYYVYNCNDFGFNNNGHWYGLGETSTSSYVTGGTRPDYVRLRIWVNNNIFLPIVVK